MGLLVLLLLETFLAWKFGHHVPLLLMRADDREGLALRSWPMHWACAPAQAGESDRAAYPVRATLAPVARARRRAGRRPRSSSGSIAARAGRRPSTSICWRAADQPAPAAGLHALRGRALGRAHGLALPAIMVDDSASEQIVDQYENPKRAALRSCRPGGARRRTRADGNVDRLGFARLASRGSRSPRR